MCTVSFFYKGGEDFILTSNIDEAVSRKTLPPAKYDVDGVQMIFPKDELAGGTWIGSSEKDRLICLLNGAYEKHVRKPSYRKSRGLVVKELLASDDIVNQLKNYDLTSIEPFTLIVVDWNNGLSLHELVWDEKERVVTKLPLEPKIWSSSTLYTNQMKAVRREWFERVFNGNESQDAILDFHENYGVGDKDIDLQIDRGALKTVSITSVKKDKDVVSFSYKDLIASKSYKCSSEIISVLNE